LNCFFQAKSGTIDFFVGAAVENAMATEFWEQLEKGILSNAANLTKAAHTEAICLWIFSL